MLFRSYDGYFAIVTSELDYDAKKIREVYHGLWRIEESFRIMKSDFDARPIYLNKREHIRAHFLICFVALVILRLIQNGMGSDRLSVERIAEALREANCLRERGGKLIGPVMFLASHASDPLNGQILYVSGGCERTSW